MLLGSATTMPPDEVYFVILLGQSNADGRAMATRLANTQYNYKGIAAGYPAVRAAQDQYTITPPGVYVYFKTAFASADQSLDDGAWAPLEIGVNNCHSGASAINFVGPELSLCTRLHDITGKEIRLIKCGYSDTGLTSTITNSSPAGNWNSASRNAAMLYFVDRAMRDFRSENPTKRAVLLGVNWWQGENDGSNAISQATYETQFASLLAFVKNHIYSGFVIEDEPIWNLVKLDFNRNAAEATINAALAAIVAANTGFYLVDPTPYPQEIELSAAEALPLPVGSPNAEGRTDDAHASYIMQLAVGEYMADNIIAHHGL